MRDRCVRGRRFAIVVALLAGIAVLLGAPGPARAVEPKVRVELLSEVASIVPGETFWLALRQEIAPGWHTYWMNPGDSGEPPRIEWSLPKGFTAGDFVWPPPERIAVGPAMTYGYSNGVVLPVAVTAPRDLVPGTRLALRGQASWIVCEKICIPEEAPLALTLPVSAGPAQLDPRERAADRRRAPVACPRRAPGPRPSRRRPTRSR